MARGQTVNVTEVIDGGRFCAFQWMVAIWCAVLVTLDGFDAGTINYVVPTIVREWHVPGASMGPVFGAGLFGLMIGTLVSGPISDRYGRKRTLLGAIVVYCVFALATTFAHSVRDLIVLRFLNEIGVGGLMPTSYALTAEYAPKRIRATVIALMFLGYPLGAGGGGFIGPAVIPHFGWQAMFLLAGVVPLLVLPAATFSLPESIRFLLLHAGRPDRVVRLMNRLTRSNRFSGADHFTMAEEKLLKGFPVKHLFLEGRALNTVLLWITFFCNLLVLFALASWLPLVLHDNGVPLAWALRLGGMISWAGIVGTVIWPRWSIGSARRPSSPCSMPYCPVSSSASVSRARTCRSCSSRSLGAGSASSAARASSTCSRRSSIRPPSDRRASAGRLASAALAASSAR